MKHTKIQPSGIERTVLLFTMLTLSGIVIFNMLATLIMRLLSGTPYPVWAVSAAAVIVAAVIAVRTNRLMPAWLDGTARRHPVKAAAMALACLLAVVQTVRITANRVDPGNGIAILTSNEFWTQHECGTSYFHAVELNDRGEENIYHADHYPVLNREIEPHSDIQGLKVEDSYQYPPQFLILPKAMLSLTHDYPTIRMVWFALQYIGIAAVLLLLARWVGGQAGRTMAMMAPLLITAPAALYAFQYTQFHFAVVALAIGGMLAIEKERTSLGGALLGFAIVGKIFPGFLLLLLLMEKRWKAVAWTLGYCAAYTVAAYAMLGSAPFSAFLQYQLPRLQSFAAFAFLETWPEVRFELITANLSPYGQIVRLGELGVPGMGQQVASLFNSLFVLAVIASVFAASRRIDSRVRRAQVWLGILGLASMASPAAWGDYITLPALWLLTTLVPGSTGNRFAAITWGIGGIFFYFLIGTVPFGTFSSHMITYLLSSVSFILLVGLQGWAVTRKTQSAECSDSCLVMHEAVM